MNVLIVDTDAVERTRIRAALSAIAPDLYVQEETTCSGALFALRVRAFDCALVGQDLVDGPAMCFLLGARENGYEVPMVVLSRDADEQLAVEMMKAGAADYLNRLTATPSAIVRSIQSVVRMQSIEREKRQVEETLERSREYIRLLVDGAKDYALFMMSTAGVVVSWNPGAERLFGYPESEILGRPASLIYVPEDQQLGVPDVERKEAEERGRESDTRWYMRRDGSRFWGDGVMTALRDEKGRLRGFGLLVRDATERRSMEQLRAEESMRQKAFMRDILASVTDGALRLCINAADLPDPLPLFRALTVVGSNDLSSLRAAVRDAGNERDFDPMITNDLVIAVSEAGMNAVVHAGGGEVRVCADDDTIQVWIVDHGKGIAMEQLPHATLERGYTTAGSLGQGFKMMLQTVDRSWLLTGPSGTSVVLVKFRQTPDPHWKGL